MTLLLWAVGGLLGGLVLLLGLPMLVCAWLAVGLAGGWGQHHDRSVH